MINIFCDGGCIVGKNIGARSHVVVENGIIRSINGAVINRDGLTNNQAEYSAIIHAMTVGCSDEFVTIHSDSEIVIKQINGEYKVKDEHLIKDHALIAAMRKGDYVYTFVNEPRTNKYIQIADKMNKILMNEAKP